jgi:hypothetical protein
MWRDEMWRDDLDDQLPVNPRDHREVSPMYLIRTGAISEDMGDGFGGGCTVTTAG